MSELSQAELSLVASLTRQNLLSPQQLSQTLELRRELPHLAEALLASGALPPSRIESALSQAGVELRRCAACDSDWLARPGDGCPACGGRGQSRPVSDRIGRYRLVKELARGGMGVVHEALDERLGRPIALKLIGQRSPELLARFLREGRLAAQLSHPGIIPIHEVGSADGEPYIAMELIDGRPLDRAIAELPERRRVALLRDVALAVGHAHAHGVVHRDLKPANVLVTTEGRAVVTDFGLARAADSDTGLTASGAVLGTAHYMAPEQVAGQASESTPATDVWAMGVMLYEAIAGRRPFAGQTAAELYQAILEEEPPRLAGTELAWVCLKALEKSPDRRYADGAALAADLSAWLEGGTVDAGSHQALYRLRKAVRRRSGLLTVLTLLVGVLAFAGLVLEARRSGGRPAALPAAPAPRLDLQRAARLAREAARSKAVGALARKIEETRAQFYIADADMRAQLAALEQQLLEAEKGAGRNGQLWQLIGIGWFLLGWAERAEAALLRATPDTRTRYYQGRIALERARVALIGGEAYWTARVRAQLRQALQLLNSPMGDLRPLDRLVARAYIALVKERPREVKRLCLEGARRYGDQLGSEEFWLLRTWIGTPAERLASCKFGLRRCPHHPWLTLMEGVIYQTQQDYPEALRRFTRAIRIAPRLALAYSSRAQVRWLTGDKQGASEDFGRAIALDSQDAVSRANRGSLSWELGRATQALRDLTDAVRVDPGLAVAFCNRSAVQHALGRLEQARADADRAIGINPKLGQAWNNRGNARKDSGDLKGAVADYTEAIRLDPKSADRWANRAEALALMADRKGAIADYTRALALNPEDAPACYNRGNLRRLEGDLKGALADYGAALRLEPRHVNAWVNRAALRRLLGDRKGSLADYDRAIALTPDNAELLTNRGSARGESGDFKGALADLDKALRVMPGYPRALLARGWTYFLLGRTDEAAADYRSLLDRQPRRADLWLRLGMALGRGGKRREALTALRKGRALAGPGLRARFDQLIERLEKK